MTEHEIRAAVAEWYEINAPIGEAFGYPVCCINEFCNQPPDVLQGQQPTKEDVDRFWAGCIDGVFTGFIPCYYHAKLILSGEISLVSLIKNRDPNFLPFPNQW